MYAMSELPFQTRWCVLHETAMGRYLFEREYRFICEMLAHCEQGSLLEIGCGSGRLTLHLANEGRPIVALDRDGPSLATLAQRAQRLPLLHADGMALPFANASFMVVVAVQCFDYVDPERFFAEVWRVLRPGGLLVFDTQNRHSYKWPLKPLIGRAHDSASANLSWPEVRRSLGGARFRLHAARGFSWIPFRRESDSAIIATAARVERFLALEALPAISPKILVAAIKSA